MIPKSKIEHNIKIMRNNDKQIRRERIPVSNVLRLRNPLRRLLIDE